MATQYTARTARSVHLQHGLAPGDVFYNEMTVEQSTRGSYFMACGFTGGYFGIQELNDGTKIALFSIWDSPTDKVACVYQADNVLGDRFGGEGTGGQKKYPFSWQLGQVNRFCVTTKVAGQKTDFSAYLHIPDQQCWENIAILRVTTGGRNVEGTYSFIEDFRRDIASANETRRALYGNTWMRGLGGNWHEANSATFTASQDTQTFQEALDRFDAGTSPSGQFYLQTGGQTPQTTPLGTMIYRPATGRQPTDLPVG